MDKQTNFNMKIEPTLKREFIAAATASDRTASQLVRDMMRDYIKKQQKEASYNEFLRKQVEAGRKDFREGRYHTNDEVEAFFKAKRKALGSDE